MKKTNIHTLQKTITKGMGKLLYHCNNTSMTTLDTPHSHHHNGNSYFICHHRIHLHVPYCCVYHYYHDIHLFQNYCIRTHKEHNHRCVLDDKYYVHE